MFITLADLSSINLICVKDMYIIIIVITLQLVSLQTQGGALGPMQIVLTDSLLT